MNKKNLVWALRNVPNEQEMLVMYYTWAEWNEYQREGKELLTKEQWLEVVNLFEEDDDAYADFIRAIGKVVEKAIKNVPSKRKRK